jgi:hypothetical protein
MPDTPHLPAGMDTNRPTPARIYDYMLRGHQNFEADREACARLVAAVPESPDIAFANRGFHQRAAKWIAQQGIKQFIDIGSGLPTAGNTHEVVLPVNREARVIYVDNDPMVALHSKDIIEPGAAVSVICADMREPDSILNDPELLRLIDLSQPAALCITAVLHFVADESDPYGLISRYVHAMAPGSYLSLSHLTDEHKPPAAAEGFRRVFDTATERLYYRTREEFVRFFDGLELVPPYEGAKPGIVFAGDWGADDPALADSEGSRWLYCGVARIP